MQLIPIDEAVREIQLRDAEEECKFEVARKMLTEGLSADVIKRCTGLDEEDILALG